MGWDFRTSPCTKKEIIDDCIANTLCSMTCLYHVVKGNELWTVWKRHRDNESVIILFLLASREGKWGYKEISEAEHPYYFKCPIGFLGLAPVTNADWRKKVYEYTEAQINNRRALKKIKNGMVITLDVPGNDFRVTHLKPLQGMSLRNNRLYRLVKTRVIDVRESEPQANDKLVWAATPTDRIW
jgi:hypothetical protein